MSFSSQLREGVGVSHAPNLENLSCRRTKTVVQSQNTSAGQPTGPRTIGELLLLKKKATDNKFSQGNLTPPKNLVKLRPWKGQTRKRGREDIRN